MNQDEARDMLRKAKDEALDAVNATGDRSRSVWRRYAGFAIVALVAIVVIAIVRAIL